jgi:hypothetical protein
MYSANFLQVQLSGKQYPAMMAHVLTKAKKLYRQEKFQPFLPMNFITALSVTQDFSRFENCSSCRQRR